MRCWSIWHRALREGVHIGGLNGLLMRLCLCLCLFSSLPFFALFFLCIIECVFIVVHSGCRDFSCDQLRPLMRLEKTAKMAQCLAVAALRRGMPTDFCRSAWFRASEQDFTLVLSRITLWCSVTGYTCDAARCVSKRAWKIWGRSLTVERGSCGAHVESMAII